MAESKQKSKRILADSKFFFRDRPEELIFKELLSGHAGAEIWRVENASATAQYVAKVFIAGSELDLPDRFVDESNFLSSCCSIYVCEALESGSISVVNPRAVFAGFLFPFYANRLERLMASAGVLPSTSELLTAMAQLASAVAIVHERRIVHCDISQSNVRLDGKGDVKLCDFGSAVHADTTRRITVQGTDNYMAPEAKSGSSTPADRSLDIFSLGCVFLELWTGRLTGPVRSCTQDALGKLLLRVTELSRKAVADLLSTMLDHVASKRPTAEQVYRACCEFTGLALFGASD